MSQEEFPKKHFKEEVDANLLVLQRRLVDLESEPDNKNYVNELFRAAHTINSAARMMKFPDISATAYNLETIFGEMRDNGSCLKPEIINSLLEKLRSVLEEKYRTISDGNKETL